MSRLVDARGRSCPEPVILARQGLAAAAGEELVVLVDTAVARENVSRFLSAATKRQPTVAVSPDGGWSISVKA